VSQKLTIRSLRKQTLMMVTPFSEGRHLGLHLREFGICAIYSMSTSITPEGKWEPCIEKNINSTTMNRSTKALQIVKYLEGTFNGNCSLSMGKGCNLYDPSRTTTRTYEGNFVGLAMDRIENRKSPASPIQVKTAANWIRKLKPNANRKSQKITNIIVDPHALITTYKHIKSKLRNMTPRGDDEHKTFWGGGEGKPFFFGHQLKMVLAHCKTTMHEKISIQTRKTNQHPKTYIPVLTIPEL
jgi:hypothetical protein